MAAEVRWRRLRGLEEHFKENVLFGYKCHSRIQQRFFFFSERSGLRTREGPRFSLVKEELSLVGVRGGNLMEADVWLWEEGKDVKLFSRTI